MTKDERREYMERWRAEHKEHIKAYRQEYYLKHKFDGKTYAPDKQKVYENVKRWREKNREHYNEYQREYQRDYRKRKAYESWR